MLHASPQAWERERDREERERERCGHTCKRCWNLSDNDINRSGWFYFNMTFMCYNFVKRARW